LINLMCIMHQSDRYGYLIINGSIPLSKDIAPHVKLHSKTYDKMLMELILKGVLSQDENGLIFCRRMVKDEELRKLRQQVGKLGGNPLLNQNVK